MGSSWPVWRLRRPSWGLVWVVEVLSWSVLGPYWGLLGSLLGDLGVLLGRLGLFGLPWSYLGGVLPRLGKSETRTGENLKLFRRLWEINGFGFIGFSWRASWGPLGCLLGASWGLLGCLRGPLAGLTPSEAVLRASLGRLGALLGVSWAILGSYWADLGPSWEPRRLSRRYLGGRLGRFWALGNPSRR